MGHYTATTKNRCDSLPQHDAPPVTDAAQLPSVKHPEVGDKESDRAECLTLPLKMASALRELPFCSPTLEVNIIPPKVYLMFYVAGKVPLLALLESLLSPPPRGASLS